MYGVPFRLACFTKHGVAPLRCRDMDPMNRPIKASMDIESLDEPKPLKIFSLQQDIHEIVYMFKSKKLNVLLIFLLFGAISYGNDWSPSQVFIYNFLGLMPLASMLGDFTEELATHTNQVTSSPPS